VLLAALMPAFAMAEGHATADGSARGQASLADALLRDAQTTLHLRSHYLYRDKPGPTESLAWAAGGWLGWRSGWAGDAVRLGLTAYTSQKLLGPADKDGAALLLAGQQHYTVMGEAYGALKIAEQQLAAGRFLVNQYEVNPQDTRMTPRTFQGAALAGTAGGVDYFVGRLDKMKSRNWDHFEDVAGVAGAPATVTEPLWLVSARGALGETLSLGFASYRVRHVLASTYADAAWLVPVGTDTRLRLGGQYMRQGSTGDRLLTGAAFGTSILGLKADLIHGPLTVSAIAMQTGRGAAYRMPFGSWAGYTSRIINNFNRAGERVRAIDAVVDCARLGAPGLTINATATTGDTAIDAATGAGLSKNAEVDVTVDYRFSAARWPPWARALALRARVGRFEQRLGGVVDSTTEHHLIVNYTVMFK
jgi:hypothetical protein